ncbi:hypothetical protein RFI_12626, partial [Reticulomyxa filosa]
NNKRLEKLIGTCKGNPEVVMYAVLEYTQGDAQKDSMEIGNVLQQLTTKAAEYNYKTMNHKYYLPATTGGNALDFGQIREKINNEAAREFWVTTFQYSPFGDWVAITQFIKKFYREKVGTENAKRRPLNIDSPKSFEHEFIMDELFPHFAALAGVEFESQRHFQSENKTKKKKKNLLLRWLQSKHKKTSHTPRRSSLSITGNDISKEGSKRSNRDHSGDKYSQSRDGSSRGGNDLSIIGDGSRTNSNGIPIDVFGMFFEYFNKLLDLVLLPEIAPFYFRSDPTLIIGMIPSTRAVYYVSKVKVLSFKEQLKIKPGTCLFRFSRKKAALVLVCGHGTEKSLRAAQHTIEIDTSKKKPFQINRKSGVVRENSLHDVVFNMQEFQSLFYLKTNGTPDFLSKKNNKDVHAGVSFVFTFFLRPVFFVVVESNVRFCCFSFASCTVIYFLKKTNQRYY